MRRDPAISNPEATKTHARATRSRFETNALYGASRREKNKSLNCGSIGWLKSKGIACGCGSAAPSQSQAASHM
jgi:hypothetical protein